MCALSTWSKSLTPGVCRGRGLTSSAESTSSCHGEAWESSVKATVRSLSLGLCDRNMEPGVWQSPGAPGGAGLQTRKFPVSVGVCHSLSLPQAASVQHTTSHTWRRPTTRHPEQCAEQVSPGIQTSTFSGLAEFFACSKGYSKLEHIQAGGLHLAERKIERFDVPSQC